MKGDRTMHAPRASRRQTAIAVLVLTAAVALALAACGSSGTPDGAKSSGSAATYTDTTHGYSVTVPAPFVRSTAAPPNALGQFKDAVSWSYTGGTSRVADKIDVFLVGVMSTGSTITDADAQKFIDQALADSAGLAKEIGDDAKVLSATATTVDGRPAAQFDLKLKGPGGDPARIRLVVVVGTTELYMLWGSAWEKDWALLEPSIDAAITSFTVGG
jgi:hypothetical protein